MDSNSCLDVQHCVNHFQCNTYCYRPINVLPKPKPKKSKSLCTGCRNDYYNNEKDGCWKYSTAKVTIQAIPHSLSQRPPWFLFYVLTCYTKQYH
jgi:hypothetical protein